MNSYVEENYLKEIFHLSKISLPVQTNTLAEKLNTKAASVTDMIKKLSDKRLINYKKYHGVTLTDEGNLIAKSIIRKHRLWEVFLVEKLNFKWYEVHEMAEELEHIKSNILIERLDAFLGNPKYDPHGDPIPDKSGNIVNNNFEILENLSVGYKGKIIGVTNHTNTYLKHLDNLGLKLGLIFEIQEVIEYDCTMILEVEGRILNISKDVSKYLLVCN